MSKHSSTPRLPYVAMAFTTALVLLCLCGLFFFTEHQGEIYARRAQTAADRGEWDTALTLAARGEDLGQQGLVAKLTFRQGVACLEAGDYAKALGIFSRLEGTQAAEQAMACHYALGEAALADGELTQAQTHFQAAVGYADALQRLDEVRYQQAQAALAAGDALGAFEQLLSLRKLEEAQALACELTGESDPEKAMQLLQGYSPEELLHQQQLQELRSHLTNHKMAAGRGHAALMTGDGQVLCAGDNAAGQCNTQAWSKVVAVATGYAHTLGLTADGRVLSAGDDTYGQCQVSQWENVIAVCCGPWDSYGLTKEGRVLHCGFTQIPALSGWTAVTVLSAGDGLLLGLRQDGSLLSSLPQQSSPLNLQAVCPLGRSFGAVTAQGTVLAPADYGLSNWTDVVAMDSSSTLVMGLRTDGTVLVAPLLPVDAGLLAALAREQEVTGFSLAGTYALLSHRDGSISAPGAPEAIQALCEGFTL